MSKHHRAAIHTKYNGRCGYCGKEITLKQMQVDHIIPIFRNCRDSELEAMGITRGSEDIENLMPSCARCNKWKSFDTLENFRQRIGKLQKALVRDNPQFRMALDFGLITVNDVDVEFYFENKNNTK